MSSVTSHTAGSERPERSRNAKAQARHRAKRKAYIEQLEQTVTKLQTALGVSPEQVSALPPPLIKIRELEQENSRLQRENEEMRKMLSDPSGRALSADIDRRSSLSTFNDRACDRSDYKRRKMVGDEVYMSDTSSTHAYDMNGRPPPLTIPQPVPQYGHMSSQHSAHNGPSSLFSLHAPAFQMPNTPSGSSSTSSPPFSPAVMQPSSHSPVHHRSPMTQQHPSSYSQSSNHYGSVKVEDDHYAASNHNSSHSVQYSLPSFAHTASGQHHQLDNWHGYSSERGPLHHR